jgi:hypothetical protein
MTTTPTPSPEAEALPTLPVVAEEDTFEVWFEQYRMQTWLSAGCHKDRGPEPSAAWGLGSRQSLLRGWLARAALSHAPAEAAIVALRAEVAELRKDAQRYRLLRGGTPRTTGAPKPGRIEVLQWEDGTEANVLKGDALDAAIDARATLLGDGGTL